MILTYIRTCRALTASQRAIEAFHDRGLPAPASLMAANARALTAQTRAFVRLFGLLIACSLGAALLLLLSSLPR